MTTVAVTGKKSYLTPVRMFLIGTFINILFIYTCTSAGPEEGDRTATGKLTQSDWTPEKIKEEVNKTESRINSLQLSYKRALQSKTPDRHAPLSKIIPQYTKGTLESDCQWGFQKGKWYRYAKSFDASPPIFLGPRPEKTNLPEIIHASTITRMTCDGTTYRLHTFRETDCEKPSSNGEINSAMGGGYGLSIFFYEKRTLGQCLRDADEIKVEKEEVIDGHRCIVVNAARVPLTVPQAYDYRFWLDIERDFQPLKIETYYSIAMKDAFINVPGLSRGSDYKGVENPILAWSLDSIELKKIDGFWFPVKGVMTRYGRNTINWAIKPDFCKIKYEQGDEAMRKAGAEYRKTEIAIPYKGTVEYFTVDANSIIINGNIPDDKFTLDFPPGAEVIDYYKNKLIKMQENGNYITLLSKYQLPQYMIEYRPQSAAFYGNRESIKSPQIVKMYINNIPMQMVNVKKVETSSNISAAWRKTAQNIIFTISLKDSCPPGCWYESVIVTLNLNGQQYPDEIPVYIRKFE